MAQQIQLRRDTAAIWASVNPILAQGEPGFETDTKKLKIGDGATAWSLLPYFVTTSSGGGGAVDATIIDGSANAVAGNAVFDALTLKAADSETVHKTEVVNNLMQTLAGTVLDGRQGKILKDQIDAMAGGGGGGSTLAGKGYTNGLAFTPVRTLDPATAQDEDIIAFVKTMALDLGAQ